MSTPSTIARMILACLETAYVREVFLHAVSHVQNKANPDKPPHESAVSQIQQAKHLHEMFVKDLQIEHRLTLLAETAAQIVNGEPFQVPGQSTPTPPTPEHGQNQQVLPGDLTVSEGHIGNIRHTNEYKAMYESLVGRVGEMAERVKGQSATLPDPGNTFTPPTFKG